MRATKNLPAELTARLCPAGAVQAGGASFFLRG
jgi:hypothetical protein